MGLFFYNIFLLLFKAGIHIVALFNSKAAKWVRGRKGIWEKLESEIGIRRGDKSNIIWMHCASLGEFEQGRPLLEKLRAQFPGYKFLLTFFSPSGYEIRKDYKAADWVFYLPMDGAKTAGRFLQIVNPALVIFVKYEFWYYYLEAVSQKKIPLLLVSALFRDNAVFFKWYGSLQRKMLSFFNHLFLQNEKSRSLLSSINVNNASVSGDTRFDRVIEIAEGFNPIPVVEKFTGSRPTIVAGSTWPPDEDMLRTVLKESSVPNLKLVLAPHEISKDHLTKLKESFPGAVFYSQLQNETTDTRTENSHVLIIDNIGMLSRLYNYAFITYIGGGFGKGIHNTLEAAVYGKPVLFGPSFQKFQEAIALVECGGACVVHDTRECMEIIERLSQNEQDYKNSCNNSKQYVWSNRGATQAIVNYIQENRLLTR